MGMLKGQTDCLEILKLYSEGNSYGQIAKIVGRQKRSIVRTIKNTGVRQHRDKNEMRRKVGYPMNGKVNKAIMRDRLSEIAEIKKQEALACNYFFKPIVNRRRHLLRMANPAHRAKFLARHRVKNFLKNKGAWSSGGSVSKWIGCTGHQLKQHLESMFRDGMCWENHGLVWEIDHIIPLASADMTNISNVVRLSHYTNLQPLLVHENRAKSDHVISRAHL